MLHRHRAVRFTRSSGVRYDCAFAPAPIGAAGGCVLGRGGGWSRSRPPNHEEVLKAVAAAAIDSVRRESATGHELDGEAGTPALDRGDRQRLLGPLVLRAGEAMGYHFAKPAEPIPPFMVMVLLIVVVMTVLSLIVRSRLSVENPGQAPDRARRRLARGARICSSSGSARRAIASCRSIATFGVFILLGNYMGLIPGLMAPTSSINVTLGCALTIWVYYHYQGIRENGHREVRGALLGAARRAVVDRLHHVPDRDHQPHRRA